MRKIVLRLGPLDLDGPGMSLIEVEDGKGNSISPDSKETDDHGYAKYTYTLEGQDRYKMFRNFMVNDLGVTKEDIRQWTLGAIRSETQKMMGQINVEGIVHGKIKQGVRDALVSYGDKPSQHLKAAIREVVADLLVDQMSITLKEK